MTTKQPTAEDFVTNPLAAQVKRYHAEKPQGDIDMVGEVRKLLIQAGCGDTIQHYDNHPKIKEATGKHSDVQRHCLNRYWAIQMGNVEKPSFNERSYLLPNGSKDEWLKAFNLGVMPFIIEHDLPQDTNG